MRHNTENILKMVSTAMNNLSSDTLLDMEKDLNKKDFFNEFRLLKIQLPRRSGKTTAAYELLQYYPSTLLINCLRNSSIPYKYENIKNDIINIKNIPNDFFRGRHLNLVIIDNSKFTYQDRLDKLYNEIYFCCDLVLEIL